MAHKKVLSQGNVPFSWEDEPGISKYTHQNYPTNVGPKTRFSSSSSSTSPKRIPPPPPCPPLPPRRSFSSKSLWEQDDPFVAALKECSKKNGKVGVGGNSKNKWVFGSKVWMSKLIFSCKSCDVVEDNLVGKLSNLPPIPRQRYSYRGLIRMRD